MLAILCGCASGPTHTYYNPLVTDAHFKGPITILQVDASELKSAVDAAKNDGYEIIGQTIYSGKYAETKELMAQAKRVHANHIVFSAALIPSQPGQWHFGFNRFGGGGGTDGGSTDNHIVFMGK